MCKLKLLQFVVNVFLSVFHLFLQQKYFDFDTLMRYFFKMWLILKSLGLISDWWFMVRSDWLTGRQRMAVDWYRSGLDKFYFSFWPLTSLFLLATIWFKMTFCEAYTDSCRHFNATKTWYNGIPPIIRTGIIMFTFLVAIKIIKLIVLELRV